MQPAFHRDRLASFVNIKTDAGQALVDKWAKLSDGTEVDVSVDMMEMTLDIVCRAMFSSDVGDAIDVVHQEFDKANENLIKRVVSPFPLPFWLPRHRSRLGAHAFHTVKLRNKIRGICFL